MNQSNKKNLEFIKNSGVNYFLQETPRNWFENTLKSSPVSSNSVNQDKSVKIKEIIKKIQLLDSPLKKIAKKLVVFDGNLDAKVMFIGEAPGRDEDLQGLPFVGRAGKLLNKMLAAINLKREEVYITNVVNWRPPDNRTPTDDEILQFLPFLQEQIDVVNPDFIFLLGGVAAKAVLSTPLSLGKLRGSWHQYESLKLNKKILTLASYHPAFLLRSPQYKKASWEDLQMLQKRLNE
tara:strand:- start:796 stop:1500 length:705 start_codon:yes stop_codon:yes gene_type:complete